MIAQRLTSQLLAGPPARDPVTVVERILAVQGQDARGLRLAIRARSTGLVAADVDRALTLDRSLLVTWLNRGTLHLGRSDAEDAEDAEDVKRYLGVAGRITAR